MDMKKYQPDAEQLEVGKRYEFSNNNKWWKLGILEPKTVPSEVWLYETKAGLVYRYIREDQSEAGVIKEKQIKLTNGEWYLCDTQVSPGYWVEKPLKCNDGWFDDWHSSNVVVVHQLVEAPRDSSCE